MPDAPFWLVIMAFVGFGVLMLWLWFRVFIKGDLDYDETWPAPIMREHKK